MQIFIDSANIIEIKKAEECGILNGVTTNPSLIAFTKKATGKKFVDIVKEICEAVPDMPVSVEVLAMNTEGMIEEGLRLSKMSETGNIVVKLPCIAEALPAIKALHNEGVKTNLTLCFSPLQALLVAKVGASYVSLFVGRLDDVGHEGMKLVAETKMAYFNYQYKTEILVASIRNPIHILEAARIGADVVTVPYTVISQLMKHPLTDIGIAKFLEDAKTATQGVNKED